MIYDRKASIALFLCLIFLYSCSYSSISQDPLTKENDDVSLETRSSHSDEVAFPPEEAFPNEEKTEFHLTDDYSILKMGDLYIFQGDIVLDQLQVNNLQNALENSNSRSSITSSFVKYWPNHKVYYTYNTGFTGQAHVQAAITEWQSKTGLDFIYGTGNGNYIEFQNNISDGNYSNSIGMKGGKQIISLQNAGYNTGTVIHEIGHSVGLFHEHCRSDRDDYLIVNYNNIVPGYASQFNVLNITDNVNLGPLDFCSVMIYGSNYFSIGSSLPTITKLDSSTFQAQRDSLSTFDAEGVKAIYGPPYHRLESSVISSYYQDYGVSEEWSELRSYYVQFYSDKACTVADTLQYDRRLKVKNTIVRVDQGSRTYYYSTYLVTVPAGSSQYGIGVAHTTMHSEYGIESGIEEYYDLEF